MVDIMLSMMMVNSSSSGSSTYQQDTESSIVEHDHDRSSSNRYDPPHPPSLDNHHESISNRATAITMREENENVDEEDEHHHHTNNDDDIVIINSKRDLAWVDTEGTATTKTSDNLMSQLLMKAQKLKDQKELKAKQMIQANHSSSSSDQIHIRTPLIPLFVSPPLPKVEPIRTQVSCSYQSSDSDTPFDCDSTDFTSLILNQCVIKVKYTYTIFNQISQTVTLKKLIDGSFTDIIDQSMLVPEESEVSLDRVVDVDICRYAKITHRVVGIGSSVDDDSTNNSEDNESDFFARDVIAYLTP